MKIDNRVIFVIESGLECHVSHPRDAGHAQSAIGSLQTTDVKNKANTRKQQKGEVKKLKEKVSGNVSKVLMEL